MSSHGLAGDALTKPWLGRLTQNKNYDCNARLKSGLAQVPFAPDLLAAHYAVLDRQTPMKVRVVLAAALAYFIFSMDVIPDAIVGPGFTDDPAVLYAALRAVSGAIQPHNRGARRALAQ
jgi:uncharacterized membrane protein YkvA (DUF1232 family)